MPRGAHFKLTEEQRAKMSELSKKYVAEARKEGKPTATGLARARREVLGSSTKAKTEPKKKGFWESLFS